MSSCQKYFLKSNIDNTILEVTEKVMNSSILLKNISELTKINPTMPIGIECSGKYLSKFIEVIQIHEEYAIDKEKQLNSKIIELFRDFNDKNLVDFVKEICILDSDILLDAIAEIILDKMKDMSRQEITEYLEIKDDFTNAEREWQNRNLLEYFISLNDLSFPLQFPLPCASFYSIKTKFSSPLNILLSRICQRSSHSIAFRLSLCSKPLKNECDRHPLKLSQFILGFYSWTIRIANEWKYRWQIPLKTKNEKYFLAIRKRRIMTWNDDEIILGYCPSSFLKDQFEIFKKFSFSLDFLIPHKNIKQIRVCFSNFEVFISNFDLTKFAFSSVFFNLCFDDGIDIKFVYNHLIAKDLSKEVTLSCNISQNLFIRISKKSHAAKFHECLCCIRNKTESRFPEFKAFLSNYMEHDGRITFNDPYSILPEQIKCDVNSSPPKFFCTSDVLKYF